MKILNRSLAIFARISLWFLAQIRLLPTHRPPVLVMKAGRSRLGTSTCEKLTVWLLLRREDNYRGWAIITLSQAGYERFWLQVAGMIAISCAHLIAQTRSPLGNCHYMCLLDRLCSCYCHSTDQMSVVSTCDLMNCTLSLSSHHPQDLMRNQCELVMDWKKHCQSTPTCIDCIFVRFWPNFHQWDSCSAEINLLNFNGSLILTLTEVFVHYITQL